MSYRLWHAAAADSLQSCPTLCNCIDGRLPGSTVPGILQARTLEWVAISPVHESEKWKWSHSVVSNSSWPQGLQPTRLLWSMGFSRQKYWSGLPLPSPDCGIRSGKTVKYSIITVFRRQTGVWGEWGSLNLWGDLPQREKYVKTEPHKSA